MTQKDYVKLATVFADVAAALDDPHDWLAGDGRATWGTLRGRIADVLADDNARFDRDRFYAATEKVAA